MTHESLPKITKFFEASSNGDLDDPTYYRQLFIGVGDEGRMFQERLESYVECTDPVEKVNGRTRIVGAYWDFLRALAPQFSDANMNTYKKFMVRFGAVMPALFTPEQKELFGKSIRANTTGEPVLYLDEWLTGIANGSVAVSVTDEAAPAKRDAADDTRLLELQASNTGKIKFINTQILVKEKERSVAEADFKRDMTAFFNQPPLPGNPARRTPLSDSQRTKPASMVDCLKKLLKVDKEIERFLTEEKSLNETAKLLEDRIKNGGSAGASTSDIQKELDTVRQMAKMTCGRQGNQFPVLTKEFYCLQGNATGFREQVLDHMARIESIDPGIFCRVHRNTSIRIVPEVLLIPSYGSMGICWMPFDHKDVVSSRGRIAIPMYPQNLQLSILMALADLRWQTAKEKASIFWMEEGITGKYYIWFCEQKLKGDVKASFIENYILWITKESTGIQAIDKEVREIFWKEMPFPVEVKQQLKNRNLLFANLCKRDGIV